MPGPNSWNGAKKRAKRPQTNEAKRSLEQNVGRLPRYQPPKFDDSKQRDMRMKPAAAITKKKPLSDAEKRLRTLNKVLADIESLQQREADGETLDEQQAAKVDRLDDVLNEMEELMSGRA